MEAGSVRYIMYVIVLRRSLLVVLLVLLASRCACCVRIPYCLHLLALYSLFRLVATFNLLFVNDVDIVVLSPPCLVVLYLLLGVIPTLPPSLKVGVRAHCFGK